MAKQLMDDENNLKRQARRRLIGAVVLVTIVVAVLPMLLDSEPRSVVKDIELRIPDKNKAGEFVPNAALPSVPAAAQPAPSPEIVSAPAIASPVASGAAVAASQVSDAPQHAVNNPVIAPGQKQVSAAPAAAPVEAAHTEQAVQPSGYLIQIGAFSNADTAHRWQKNLVNQGIKAYTEKAGDKLRVRAGPYATREAAEKVRHRLESQGLHPNIIAQE